MATSDQRATLRRCTVCQTVYGADERFCPADGGAIIDDDSSDPLIGRTIAGRYFIRREIGKGGMGVVYEADHIGLDKRVAVKFILEKYARDREALTRFHREARNSSKIGHENIVDVTDIGDTEDGRNFIVMEYLEGADLAEVLRDGGPMAPARAVAIVRQILVGLHAAHDQGILHRDMKPENVFLTNRHGSSDFVKIMDFGISKFITARDANLRLTETGAVVGTPIYMAPEQAMASPTVDHRVDIYAVGVMLYEMLAGRPPFNAGSYLGLVSMHVNDPPPPLRAVAPGVPVPLALAVAKALEKDPNQRFHDALDFTHALPDVAALSDAAPAAPGRKVHPRASVAATVRATGADGQPRAAAPSQRTTRFQSRKTPWLVLAAVALAGAVAAAVLVARDRRGDGDEPATARAAAATFTQDAAAATTQAAALAPAPAADAGAPTPTVTAVVTGALEIDSQPPGADVSIDGVRRGKTPLTLDDVEVGQHVLRLEQHGYDPVEAAKVVRAGYVESFYAAMARRGSGHHVRVERSGRDQGGAVQAEPGGNHGTKDPGAVKHVEPPKTTDRPSNPDDVRKPNPYVN